MIQAENICYATKGVEILRDVSIEINPGDCVGLTGPSGCGKTTLALILAGHVSPTSGEILVYGKKQTKPGRRILLVHQEGDLFPWQTVFDQVGFVIQQSIPSKANREQEIAHLLQLVCLADAADRFPSELSGGMKKRLSIARALAAKPDLLILDEVFSSLDLDLRERLQQDLRCIWKETNSTILVITHDQRDLENLTARTVQLTSPSK